MTKKAKTKRPWKEMKICKVALNPEQAVLSCCDSVQRVQLWGASSGQCDGTVEVCGLGGYAAAS
ncbi:MAG: hypothetical protein PHV17_09530 [Candidatus Omnitrophica bacterium]|nr:hypothetical protein [Candidatus Omnitrophota bacterium]